MSFLSTHTSNISNRIPSNINRANRGDIILGTYRSEINNKVTKSMWLILDDKPKGDIKKIHLLDLSLISYRNLLKLRKYTAQNTEILERINGEDKVRLVFNTKSKAFYHNPLKQLLQLGMAGSYRTMFKLNFSAVHLVNYEYTESKKDDPNRARAPKGGVIEDGKLYKPGQFLPK